MEKLEKFAEILSTFRSVKDKVHLTQLERFNTLLTELKDLETKVYPQRKEEARLAVERNKNALQLSSFELMEYNFRENSHSNVLQYLLDYSLIGDFAIELLTQIIKLCEVENEESLLQKISKKNYSITREKFVSVDSTRGRIDLFIVDDINSFVIVIENKILADVTEKIFKTEETESILKTQLDDYSYYINTEYKHFDNKLFILLQHKPDEKEYHSFKKIDYRQLENIINNIDCLDDDILKDYKRLLRSLNNGITKHKKIELLRKANALKTKHETKLTLTEIEQIKFLSYE